MSTGSVRTSSDHKRGRHSAVRLPRVLRAAPRVSDASAFRRARERTCMMDAHSALPEPPGRCPSGTASAARASRRAARPCTISHIIPSPPTPTMPCRDVRSQSRAISVACAACVVSVSRSGHSGQRRWRCGGSLTDNSTLDSRVAQNGRGLVVKQLPRRAVLATAQIPNTKYQITHTGHTHDEGRHAAHPPRLPFPARWIDDDEQSRPRARYPPWRSRTRRKCPAQP